MKCKKYSCLIMFVLVFTILINPVDARRKPAVNTGGINEKKCYYMSSDETFKIRLTIKWREETKRGTSGMIGASLSDYAKLTIDKLGENNYPYNDEGVINWWEKPNGWKRKECTDGKKVCFEFIYKNRTEADSPSTEPNCPQYLVMEDNGQIAVWATNSSILANDAVTKSRNGGHIAHYGIQTTQDKYFAEFVEEGLVEFDDGEPTCTDYNELFGDKNDEDSISYMIHSVLQYVRIIVPILVILLGTIDFAKAVIAGKEDQMRKAQMDFVKRIIIGVAVFFVPLIVDIVMELADIVWAGEYIHCDF